MARRDSSITSCSSNPPRSDIPCAVAPLLYVIHLSFEWVHASGDAPKGQVQVSKVCGAEARRPEFGEYDYSFAVITVKAAGQGSSDQGSYSAW